MLEVSQKRINILMFGPEYGNQNMILALGRAPSLEKGVSGFVPTQFLGDEFTGGMGTMINSSEACVGIVINEPSIPINQSDIGKLVKNGINIAGAYNMVAISTCTDLAIAVGKYLFKGEVEPTIKIHFDKTVNNGSLSEPRTISKVEIIFKGYPTGHPFWTLGNF
jgi:hypothetical protein